MLTRVHAAQPLRKWRFLSSTFSSFVWVNLNMFSYVCVKEEVAGGKMFLPSSAAFLNIFKKQRGEKKPVPNEQKDERYFERRRRNNHAAKKSRDARKMREDQVMLTHQNKRLRSMLKCDAGCTKFYQNCLRMRQIKFLLTDVHSIRFNKL